jgi:hypothetical protein
MQQQINHVSHVCFIYSRINLPKAMEKFGKALGINDWDGPIEIPDFGILQAQSVKAGIELLAPLDEEEGPFAEHLRTKGEGFYALVYGVADVRSAAEQAAKAGIAVVENEKGEHLVIDSMKGPNGKPAHSSWTGKFERYEEIPLHPLFGVNFFLGQLEPFV